MDPVSVSGLIIAAAQMIGACLKSSRTVIGPSQHKPKYLQEIISDLYSFNAAIGNLQTHLSVCEEDQARLHTLSDLQWPLQTSIKSLNMIKTWLEDASFVRKNVAGARFDKKLKACLRSLEISRDLFHDVLQMDDRTIRYATERYARNIAEDVRGIQTDLKTFDDRNQRDHEEMKERQLNAELQTQDGKILNWLSSLRFASKLNDVLSRRHEQTGAWFLNSPEFQRWVTNPAKTLFCPGIPGAGKTVLASISIQYLKTRFEDEGFAVLYLFCNHADAGYQKSNDLVASVLMQLVQTVGVTAELRTLYERHQAGSTPLKSDEVSDLLQSTIKNCTRVFIVIDALDECPETSRKELIPEIRKLRSVANLLVTTRLVKSIEREFHDAVRLEIHASDTDLETYIRSKTQQDSDLAPYTKEDPSLQHEIVKTIVGNARGMFLLAQLHVESLAEQMNKKNILKALSSLPKELDETYDQTMKRIRSQRTSAVRLAEQVLAWISNARRPLSVEELQHALAVEPGDVVTCQTLIPQKPLLTVEFAQTKFDADKIVAEEKFLSVCAGLVTVDRESKVIRLVHYTTQDYFQRACIKLFPTIQLEIAEACITYLELDDFESDAFTQGEKEIPVTGELCSTYPFLDYAGKNWGHHAPQNDYFPFGPRISRLLTDPSRLSFACELIDDSSIGLRNFGPSPVFLLVERGEDWHDDGRHKFNVEYSSHRLEGNEDIVRLLAKKGITVDLGVDDGELIYISVLSKCEGDRHSPVLKLLVEFGATYNPDNITSYTPLMLAVTQGDNLDVWKELQRSSDVNEKNQRGRNAIIYAALARHVAGVEALLEANADVHSKDEDGMTALCAACKGGNKRIVKLLLKSGADVSAKNKCGRTAISIATESGHAQLLPLLQGHVTDSDSEEVLNKHEAEFRRFFLASGPRSVRKGTLGNGLDKWAQAVNEKIKEEANKTNPTSAEKGKKKQKRKKKGNQSKAS